MEGIAFTFSRKADRHDAKVLKKEKHHLFKSVSHDAVRWVWGVVLDWILVL